MLDQQAKNLAMAIRQHETGNRPLAGGSGESGRYQFMPGTWRQEAGRILGDSNAPQTLENENKVAYTRIKEWKDKGYNPAQIAALWNSGGPEWEGKVGVNKYGQKYDVPAYVNSVYANYKKLKAETEPQGLNYTPKPQAPTPEYGAGDMAKDVAIGVGKSGLETVRGASSLGERFLQGALKTILPKSAERRLGLDRQTGAEALIPESAIAASNTAQQVGKFGGDVAQFLIPGGGIGRASKALEATSAVSKLGKAAPIASRIITEAGVAAGGEAIKSGKVSEDTLKAAGIGAAFPAATGLMGKAAKSVVSTRNAERLVNSLIKPLKSQRTFGKNPGRVIAEEGIVANTLEELGNKVYARRQQVGKEIKRAIGSKTRPVNASAVLQPIDEAIAKASRNPRTNASVIARLQAVKDDLLGVVDNQSISTDPLFIEARKYKNVKDFIDAQEAPKTTRVWIKSKFSDTGAYADVPIKRKVDNVTLYQGSKQGEKRQFWTPNREYAAEFGDVKKKTGSFYLIDNGNRVTDVYVPVPEKTTSNLYNIWNEANQSTRNLGNIKPVDLFDFKSQVADLTRWTGNASDDKLVNLALQQTYTRIRKTLENTVGKQKLSKLNQKYADLIGAGDAIKNRIELIERSNINPLTSRLTGLTVGAGTGGVVGGIPGAVVGMAAERIASSPTVKLGTAKVMSQAARKGLPESVKRVGRGIGRAISTQ